MDYALIKQGRVANVIVADKAFIDAHGAELAEQCVDVTKESPRPALGWTYDGAKFSPPAEK